MTTIEKIKAEIERRITDNTFGAKLELIDILAWLDTLESEKPIDPETAMKELDEKIALVKQRGTWDGVDVDKYMDEVRGREPENPMDLEEEIKRFVAEYGYERSEDILLIAIVARQFYELGCRRAAEKYDEIEYNRQRAEESVPNDLAEEVKRYYSDNFAYLSSDQPTLSILTNIARHFAEWGAEHAKECEECPSRGNTHSYLKGLEDGKKEMKEQMMKEAVEGEIVKDISNKLAVTAKNVNLDGFKFGEKVKIIIVKE